MSADLFGSPYGSTTPELRVVLLGNIGCGKTLSVDTILGQRAPSTPLGYSKNCQVRQGISEGRRLTLVEAPRWYWSGGHVEADVKMETKEALAHTAPGPHAFLLLVPVGEYTEVEGHVPAEMVEIFGEGVLSRTLVLLTCSDYLMGRTEQAYLEREDPGLRELIRCCGGRYHFINNRQPQDREQVCTLLEKIEDMVGKNGGHYIKASQPRQVHERVPSETRKVELERTTYESGQDLNLEMRWNGDGRQEMVYTLPSRRRSREEVDVVEESVAKKPLVYVLNSTHSSENTDVDGKAIRSPGFKLNKDGAILSQLSEDRPATRVVNTFHHRINSSGDGSSPEVSPTAYFPPAAPCSPLSSCPSDLRLVLLGRSGSGKSSAGNRILGRQEFVSRPDSLTAITRACEKKGALTAGKKVAVVDTPDWFSTESSPEDVQAQISSCVALSSPGPHAFLLCVPVDQPAKTELHALGALESVFGAEAVKRRTMILFTYADRLRESERSEGSVEAYIAGKSDLLKLVEKCGDRFHVLERGVRATSSVGELLQKVEQTVREAGGGCYSSPVFQEAEKKVKQRQKEIAKERRGGQFNSGRGIHSTIEPFREEDEQEVQEDAIEEYRAEAEMSVSNMKLETLPEFSSAPFSPSLVRSLWEKCSSGAKMVPKLLADGSWWIGDGAKKVAGSPVWGKVGSGAKGVKGMVIDSSVWEKMGGGAKGLSKLVADNAVWEKIGAKKALESSSALVGSGKKMMAGHPMWEKVGSRAKNIAQSPVWGKVGSGAKMMADGSVRLRAGVGSGAKKVAQSPVWGKVGSGAMSGAKIVADRSMQVGAGIGAGAKKVAQSPVWGKVGSGAKTGVKMVAESSVWEKITTNAKKIPKVVIGGAVLGLVLGVFFGGALGGALGATAGSVVSEVGRRRFGQKTPVESLEGTAKDTARAVNEGMESLVRDGGKLLKTE